MFGAQPRKTADLVWIRYEGTIVPWINLDYIIYFLYRKMRVKPQNLAMYKSKTKVTKWLIN